MRLKKLLIITAIAFTMTCPVAAGTEYEHLYSDTKAQRIFIEAKIHEYFPEPGLAEAMIAVANCESTGLIHWLPDGSLRFNIPKPGEKATSAKGVLQILFTLHRPDYTRLGLDMNNIDDYMRYARHLFDTQGPENAWAQCTVQMPKTVLAALR